MSTTAAPTPQATATGLDLSTGTQTLGEMILRSGERDGVALRYKEGGVWREISYRRARRVGSRHRPRADRARDRARRAGLDPRRHAARVDDRRRGQLLRGDRRGADLPDELAGGVRVRARAIPRRGSSSARTRRSWRRSSRSATRCPALEHVIALTGAGAGAISLDELHRARRRHPRAAGRRARRCGQSGRAWRASSTRPARPDRRRRCILTHRNFTEATHTLEERLDLTRTDAPIEFFMFLPLAHVFARITQVFTLDLGGTLDLLAA